MEIYCHGLVSGSGHWSSNRLPHSNYYEHFCVIVVQCAHPPSHGICINDDLHPLSLTILLVDEQTSMAVNLKSDCAIKTNTCNVIH